MTPIVELHEKARRALEAADSAAQADLREAAEYLAQAKELGARLDESAAAVGRSKPWISLLLTWRKANYSYPSPFHPPSKSKASLSDKPAITTAARRRVTAAAAEAMQTRARAVEALWRRKQTDGLTGSRDEFDNFYRAWCAKASARDREWARRLVLGNKPGMGGKAA